MALTTVIKRDFSKEKFDRKKLSKSIQRASMRTDAGKYKAKIVADKVSRCVKKSLAGVKEIRSSEIKRMVVCELEKENKTIAEEFKYFRKE